MAKMRAKLQISNVVKHEGGSETLSFHAVCKKDGYDESGLDDDNTYAIASPSASLSITIANPALHGQFKQGEKYYVDFTLAEDAPAAAEAA